VHTCTYCGQIPGGTHVSSIVRRIYMEYSARNVDDFDPSRPLEIIILGREDQNGEREIGLLQRVESTYVHSHLKVRGWASCNGKTYQQYLLGYAAFSRVDS
jgi:hypothetical protein